VVGDTIISSVSNVVLKDGSTLNNKLTGNPELGIYSFGIITGVKGESSSGEGIWGRSITGAGVDGTSVSSSGVIGISNTGAGLHGVSFSGGPGVQGRGSPGLWAEESQLKVDDVPGAPNQDRFLVWDNDNIVKYRNLPPSSGFDGILQDKAFVIRSGQTEVFRVDTNGASYHKGVETFDDDVIFKGTDGKGAKLVNATGETIAGFGRKDLQTGQRFGVYRQSTYS